VERERRQIQMLLSLSDIARCCVFFSLFFSCHFLRENISRYSHFLFYVLQISFDDIVKYAGGEGSSALANLQVCAV